MKFNICDQRQNQKVANILEAANRRTKLTKYWVPKENYVRVWTSFEAPMLQCHCGGHSVHL